MTTLRCWTYRFGPVAMLVLLLGRANAAPGPKSKPATVDISMHVAVLAGNNSAAAATAATELGKMAAPAAHEALLDALAIGPHPAVAEAALAAIAAQPAPADVPMIVRYSRYRGVAVRIAAMKALGLYLDPKARQALIGGLSDQLPEVRLVAAQAIGQARVKQAVPALTILLARGDLPAALALAQLADIEIARTIAEQVGQIPDGSLAVCLGAIIRRDDFGPDAARLQIISAIGKIVSNDAIVVLNDYVSATPVNPPRPSRAAAQAIVDARIGGR
jgi:hypothetical protein